MAGRGGRKLVAPERFWAELRGGASVLVASQAVGVSHFTGYRWIADVGGPDQLDHDWPGRGRPWGGRTSEVIRDRFWDALRGGVSIRGAARAAGVSSRTGHAWLAEAGGVKPRVVNIALEAATDSGRGALSWIDRCRIEDLLRAGYCPARIAALLGRHRSTITREIARSRPATAGRYRAVTAQATVERNRARPGRARKLDSGTRLHDEVLERLKKRHSPEQIAHRLRHDFANEPEMRVSHETIYQALYVQPKGALASQVRTALRTGRVKRQPHGRHQSTAHDRINISQRPAEADDRAVPGHWEGDLILGAGNQSAIGTLVERTTGFTLLLHLPSDHTSLTVANAMIRSINQLPEHLRRSLTWDQGTEMALHTTITTATGMPIYFCDPHSPWQRGTNENTNGLLRQYFPKSTDLTFYGPGLLDQVAAELNGRPRKRLNWATPAEKLSKLLSDPNPVASTT